MMLRTPAHRERQAIKYLLQNIYDILNGYFGALHWWPADTPFEIIVGAILTQNTSWRNVEAAIVKLREAEILSPEGVNDIDTDTLAELIRPSGYYHVKARRLKAFVHCLCTDHNGNLENLFQGNVWQVRDKLLEIYGIGEETADSILLYAGEKPVFVVDAYTRRILERHKLIEERASYSEIQSIFMNNLHPDAALYNQYHALLVNTGKIFCTKKRLCEKCPLKKLPAYPSL